MRRAEADVCLWSQLMPEDNSIRIEANEYIEPKHDSGGTDYVDPSLMKELLSFKDESNESFVVNSSRKWKPTMYGRYRCESYWRTLLNWLETNGISAKKRFTNSEKYSVMPSLNKTAFSPAAHNCDTRQSRCGELSDNSGGDSADDENPESGWRLPSLAPSISASGWLHAAVGFIWPVLIPVVFFTVWLAIIVERWIS